MGFHDKQPDKTMRDLILIKPINEHGRYLSTGCVFRYNEAIGSYLSDTYIIKKENINMDNFLFLDDLTYQDLMALRSQANKEWKELRICE